MHYEYVAGEKIVDLQNKLKSIKDSYRKERRKVMVSTKSGADTDSLYIPTLSWYSIADSFLQPYVGIGNVKDNLEGTQRDPPVSIYCVR